jgi:hypothetical protein
MDDQGLMKEFQGVNKLDDPVLPRWIAVGALAVFFALALVAWLLA